MKIYLERRCSRSLYTSTFLDWLVPGGKVAKAVTIALGCCYYYFEYGCENFNGSAFAGGYFVAV